MSDTSPFGFGRFVPGFDFLQSLAPGGAGATGTAAGGLPPQAPWANWVAPTVSVQELSKRIDELKAVQFWLEQNARALSATLQALEVQKMTLATLEGMNVSMGDLAKAFQPPKAAATPSPAPAPAPAAAPVPPQAQAEGSKANKAEKSHTAEDATAATAAGSAIDPMQWWGALSTQFQQIASTALKDAAAHSQGLDSQALAQASDMAQQAFKTASGLASQFAGQMPAGAGAAPAATAPTAQKTAKTSKTSSAKARPAASQPAAKKAAKTAAKKAAPAAAGTRSRRAQRGKPAA